jgi:hypothetical protein
MLEQIIPAPEAMPEQTQSSAAPQHIAGPWQFHLPQNLCRQPGLSSNDRGGHYVRNQSVQAVRHAVTVSLTSLINRSRMPRRLNKVRVDVVWYVADKRNRDPNNLAPLAKAICDAIGSNKGLGVHLVRDDSPRFMEQPAPQIVYRPDTEPEFVVTITNLGGLP